jgi:6-pyruvoyltetrahydropterin/6-carboxytetrahydropterin synthase
LKTSVTFRETFETSHAVQDDAGCGNRLHGHSWYAEVTIEGTPDPRAGLIVTPAAELLAVAAMELDRKNANDMLPGLFTTPEGIAHYIFERLRLECPGLRSVTVGFPGHHATVEV